MASDLSRDAEELARLYSEIGRRLAQTGVRDIPDLIGLHERLQRALGALGREEIGWVVERTQQLVTALERMGSDLQALRQLKEALLAASETTRGAIR